MGFPSAAVKSHERIVAGTVQIRLGFQMFLKVLLWVFLNKLRLLKSRCRNGKHRRITIGFGFRQTQTAGHFGLRKLDRNGFAGTRHMGLTYIQPLHGVFRRDMRAAAAVAVINGQRKDDPQPLSLFRRPLDHRQLVLDPGFQRTGWSPAMSGDSKAGYPANADTFERFQVFGDPIPGHIPVVPVPEHPRPGSVRRIDKKLLQRQIRRPGMCNPDKSSQSHQIDPFLHVMHLISPPTISIG